MLAVFYGALAGLALLFLVRFFEEARGMRMLPGFRHTLDRFALFIKRYLERVETFFEHIPQFTALLLRYLTAKGVRRFAHMTEGISRTAHAAADMVSYKHRYERKETRSTFLKRMSDGEKRPEPSSNEEA